MDKTQAEAIAHAMLEPDSRQQDEIRRKQAATTHYMARKRQIAWLALTGAVVGAAAAYFTGMPVLTGGFLGGIAGSAFGRAAFRLLGNSRAA